MSRAVAIIAVSFSAGIFFGAVSGGIFWLWAGGVLAGIALFLIFRANETVTAAVLSLTAAFAGAASVCNFDTPAGNHIYNLRRELSGKDCFVRGIVISDPEKKLYSSSFILRSQSAGFCDRFYACTGDLLVKGSRVPLPEVSSLIEVAGRITFLYRGGRGSGADEYLKRRRIFAVIAVKGPRSLIVLSRDNRISSRGVIIKIRRHISAMISRRMPSVSSGILEAMLVGEKKNVPPLIYKSMIRTGTVHILVVSGFNVGIVSSVIVLVLRIFRVPRRSRVFIVVPGIILYCATSGASPPVVRAGIMGIFFFTSWYMKSEPDVFQALFLSALAILAVNPRELFDPGFQLSFSSVFSICALSPLIIRGFKIDKIPLMPVRWAGGLAAVSVSAWCGTAGITAYYFRIVSPIAVVANILIPVIASWITLCGLGLAVSSFVCPCLSNSFASVCDFLIICLLRLNDFFLGLPYSYITLP